MTDSVVLVRQRRTKKKEAKRFCAIKSPGLHFPQFHCTHASCQQTGLNVTFLHSLPPSLPPSSHPLPVSGTQPNLFPLEHVTVPRKTPQWHGEFKFRRNFRIFSQPESNFWVRTVISQCVIESKVTVFAGVCFQHVTLARPTALAGSLSNLLLRPMASWFRNIGLTVISLYVKLWLCPGK